MFAHACAADALTLVCVQFIADAGHMCIIEKPQEINQVILKFVMDRLNEVSSTTPSVVAHDSSAATTTTTTTAAANVNEAQARVSAIAATVLSLSSGARTSVMYHDMQESGEVSSSDSECSDAAGVDGASSASERNLSVQPQHSPASLSPRRGFPNLSIVLDD